MAREAVVLALTLAVVLSGCVNAVLPVAPAEASSHTGTLLASATALWEDPQNAPHPLYNWPTLTHPPENAPSWWAPIPAADVPATIAGLEHVKRAPGGIRGAGIAVFGQLVVVPGFSAASHVVSLADPANPQVLSTFPGPSGHRGAAIIAYPSGRLVTVFATNNQLQFWDITDPTLPDLASTVNPTGGSHKVGVVPGTPIVYNANTDGEGAVITIYDATDPEAPVKVRDFDGGYGCHHVYFWVSVAQDRYRSICAGVEATQILDIADPRDPQVVVTVPVHHGVPGTPSTGVSPARFSHFAILSQDGDTLIVGDETGGGAAPGCDVHAQALGLVSVSGALGDVYFYDITQETAPLLKGWFNPGAHYTANLAVPGSCTAHHGRIVPDPSGERDLLVMGYYSAGIVLIDFTDPTFPQMVDQWATGTTTWEAWYANGYIVTGDLSRGLDVLRLV
jgi:hypothetical protein